jgi:hypothetical protein
LEILFEHSCSVGFFVEDELVFLAEYHKVVEVHYCVDMFVLFEVGDGTQDDLLFGEVFE